VFIRTNNDKILDLIFKAELIIKGIIFETSFLDILVQNKYFKRKKAFLLRRHELCVL